MCGRDLARLELFTPEAGPIPTRAPRAHDDRGECRGVDADHCATVVSAETPCRRRVPRPIPGSAERDPSNRDEAAYAPPHTAGYFDAVMIRAAGRRDSRSNDLSQCRSARAAASRHTMS